MKLREVLDDMSQQIYTGVVQQLFEHCMPYLRATNVGDVTLFRGMEINGSYQYKTPRQSRRPLDTHPVVHDAADAFFEAKFGKPLRSQSVFVVRNRNNAMRFGTPHLIFPTGPGWQMYGSPNVRDFTAHINKTLHDHYITELFTNKLSKSKWVGGGEPPQLDDEEIEQVHEAVYEILTKADYKQLQPGALNQFPEHNEIMLTTDAYYAVVAGQDEIDDLHQLIKQQIGT